MQPTLISRGVRLIAITTLIPVAVGACVSTASPGWTFAPPPPTASAAASGSAAPSGSAAASPSAAPSASAAASGSAAPSASAGASAAATVLNLKALNQAWDVKTLKAKAGAAFQIVVDNQDAGVPHDILITDAGGQQVFKGDQFSGVATKTYDVPALKAGSYPFKCTIHPTMTGTLEVK
jgi:plastocyanin